MTQIMDMQKISTTCQAEQKYYCRNTQVITTTKNPQKKKKKKMPQEMYAELWYFHVSDMKII